MRSADRPAGHPLLRGLLARATGASEGTVRADEPRHGVRWTPAGAVEPAEADAERDRERETDALLEREREMDALLERERETESETDALLKRERVAERVEPERVEPPEAGPPGSYPEDTPTGGPTPPAGLAAELTQLADLAREGLLTPQEFTTAKARLLRG
ncbi:hypothetical protein [Streptomyces sp. NPDC048269]|uniref:hypothetical protein n=1 Tax=Streptomyces sp. NPDC048269 TaxID=3155753 RepID=UPI0034302B1A